MRRPAHPDGEGAGSSTRYSRGSAWVQRGLAVTVAAFALATAAVPSANAADDPNQGGLWYFTVPGIEAAQQRANGTGITVAVIDGLLNPAAPDLVGTTVTSYPESFCANADGTRIPGTSSAENAVHATHMVSLIVGTGAGVSGQPGVRGIAPGGDRAPLRRTRDC